MQPLGYAQFMGADSSKPAFLHRRRPLFAQSSDWPDLEESEREWEEIARRRAAPRVYRHSSPFRAGTSYYDAVRDYLVAGKHADALGDCLHLGTSAGVAVFRCYTADIVQRDSESARPFWKKKEPVGWQCAPIPCCSVHLVLCSDRSEQQAAAFAADGRRLTRHNVFETCGFKEMAVPDCIAPAESSKILHVSSQRKAPDAL